MFHWTDQKIKVHGLYCVLALLLATLAHKILGENKIEMTFLDMLEQLSDIREVALICSETESKDLKNQMVLSKMSAKQKKMAEVLEISQVLHR